MTHSSTNKTDREKFYLNRQYHFTKLWEAKKKKLNRIAWLRLITFVLFVTFGIMVINRDSIYYALPSFLSLIAFLLLVKRNIKDAWQKDHYAVLRDLNRDEINAGKGDYSAFENGNEYSDKAHSFTFDLDIFGTKSVFQYLNRSFTRNGNRRLSEFLSYPLSTEQEIKERQEAVKELKEKTDWRQKFQAYSIQLIEETFDRNRLESWLKNKISLFETSVYPVLAFALPVLSFSLIGLTVFGNLSFDDIWFLLLLPLIVVGTLIRKTGNFQRDVTTSLKVLRGYIHHIRLVEDVEFTTELLQNRRSMLFHGPESASVVIKKLGKILDAFDTRNNMIMGVVLNALLLWDIHCLISFEKWRTKYGNAVFLWLDSLTEFDALSSLGTFAFNHPDFVFPEISGSALWEFRSVGHPLLDPADRVDNDLLVKNEGEIFIVTGPNMAGKSTFLRAVGVNIMLAQAGAPVCANKMVFKPVCLFTSMRTTDSLQQNESYFFAELKRLKLLLDKIGEEEHVFFLLDEILKGTNSADKSRGSEAVISKLVALKGTGLIATHDLTLSDLENNFPGKVLNKCFDAEIVDDQLVFNYKLHEGVTKNMNAVFLMKKMGIIE